MSKHDWPIDVDPVYGCWLWRGKLDREGYGLTHQHKRAHLAVYRSEVGEIPESHELDHECRRRNCVNPIHLLPVTRSENERRKAWRYRVKFGRCRVGHDLKLNAMITPEGGRICRACK